MEKQKLGLIEAHIFSVFRDRGTTRLLTRQIFGSTAEFPNSEMVRAFEDLEKKWRLLIRYTKEGDDWVSLTPEGAAEIGLDYVEGFEGTAAMPHPPKSST